MDDAKTLWCGNLSDKVSEELLYELFLQAGPLDRVKIPNDRNFGFVTFKHECSVKYAIDLLDGIELFQKRLNIRPRSNSNQNAGAGQVQPAAVGAIAELVQLGQSMLHYNTPQFDNRQRRDYNNHRERDVRRDYQGGHQKRWHNDYNSGSHGSHNEQRRSYNKYNRRNRYH